MGDFFIFDLMTLSFFDPPIARLDLLPLTYTRPCSEIRIGITTIREKWELSFGDIRNWKSESYLSEKYPSSKEIDTTWISGCLIPSKDLIEKISKLEIGNLLKRDQTLLAYRGSPDQDCQLESFDDTWKIIEVDEKPILVNNLWDIFSLNGLIIDQDLNAQERSFFPFDDPFTRIYHPENVFAEEGVRVRAAILNAENGPIYLGKNVKINEGAILYGPLAICEGSEISPGAKIRANTTIGPYCKVGGEINNSVFMGFSNKAHDGFLGNSVIGEWCNLGADTNNSNLKNNYDEVKLWNFRLRKFQKTGKQFCGLFMGDHSKCSINTMFNTGTVTGIGANIFGAGFHSNFIPSFSWGGPQGRTTFELDKFFQTAEIAMERRGHQLSTKDRGIFAKIFEDSRPYRTWEKK